MSKRKNKSNHYNKLIHKQVNNTLNKALFKLVVLTITYLQAVNPTSYCHLNTAVLVLQVYFDEAADHRAHLRLSLLSIMSLIAAVRLESDHGWERAIEAASSPHTESLREGE